MTAVYNANQAPSSRRNVHFGSVRRTTTPMNPTGAGQQYQRQAASGDDTYAAGRRYVQPVLKASSAPFNEQRPAFDRSNTARPDSRPPLPSRLSHAASAPVARKGNDYFGIATSQTPRPAQSVPARQLPRMGGPKSFTTESLLNDFLSLPPLRVTIEALFYYYDDGRSSYWHLAQNLPLHLVKTVDYEPRQYVDGIVPPHCISAAFIQQKVQIKPSHFDQAEKRDNREKESALHMYGTKEMDKNKWGKKIRVRAEIDYPRKVAWFGARPRTNGTKVFTILGATTTWDMFPYLSKLPENYNGNRQNSYVKR